MKRKPYNTFVWSAAVAGLTVGMLAQLADAHGNNPRKLDWSGDVWWGTPGPDPTPDFPPLFNNLGGAYGGEETSSDPTGDLPNTETSAPGTAPSGDLFGLSSPQIGLPPLPPEMFPSLTQVVPGEIISPADLLNQPAPTGPYSNPFVNAVPSPGTLALLGLAALAGRPRRRR